MFNLTLYGLNLILHNILSRTPEIQKIMVETPALDMNHQLCHGVHYF